MLAQTISTSTGGNSWVTLVILGVFFVLMIVMTILPQKKRQKQMQNMMDNLSIGDKVMTIGRMIGKIVSIDTDNNQVTLNVGTDDNETLIVIDRNAIGYVIEGKNKPAEPVKKESKSFFGKKDATADNTSSAEDTSNISIEGDSYSIDDNDDTKIDKDEDVKF